MDIKAKLKGKGKDKSLTTDTSAVEKKLKRKDIIADHLKLQKEYSDETLEVPHKFTKSHCLPKLQFTNKVNCNFKVGHINEHIIENLSLIINDIYYLTRNTKQITIDTNNKKTINALLKLYDKDWKEEEGVEGDNLFKVHGRSTKVMFGKTEKRCNSFRVYLKIVSSENGNMYKLMFIDPYHLVIPAPYGGKNASTVKQETYIQHQYCKDDLHDLINQLDE